MLHLPTDLVIDPITVDRLARQLAGAPDEVIGIAAMVADLPPGASTRTHAEWSSLLPLDAATDAEPSGARPSVEGAVLLRAGLDASIGASAVTLPAGTVRTDPGAVVHRAEVAPATDLDAAAEGRSPFPRRPIVLFLALDDDPLTADRQHQLDRLLDGLIDADVEPRLAGGGAELGRRRHRPCAPTSATVAALAPDVIVALDRAALEQASAWCTRRGTVLVDLTGPLTGGDVELVSWQIDRHPTRLRARVDPAIDAPALARLVNRLAAGPQPAPPVDRPSGQPAGETAVTVRRPGASRTVAVLGARAGVEPGPLQVGLIDRLAVAGHEVAADGPVVVVVVERGDDLDHVATLDLHAGYLAADPEVVDQLRARGARAQRVPVMTPLARQQELRSAAEAPVASSGGAIGWTVLGPPAADDPVTAAVADALLALVEARPELGVEIVADPDSVPESLTVHPQVRRVAGRPDAGEQARWTAHVVTVGLDRPLDGTPVEVALLEAAHAGVPTLVPVTTARAVGGMADPRLTIEEPAAADAWTGPLQLLLDGDDRPARSAWALATSEALEQPAATDLVIARLLGWLDRGSAR